MVAVCTSWSTNGGEAALRGLRRPVENDRCREIAPGLRARFGIALARLVERAADLHLHDLEPWRKQPLRLLIGLEHRLQTVRRGAPWSSSRSPTRFSSSARLDRNEATSNWIVTAASPAVPKRTMSFSPMMRRSTSGRIRFDISSRSFVVVGGEQGRSRRDQPIGRARDLHRADDLRHAGIDQLEPIADLAKRIDAGGRSQYGEGADPEECEQQPRAHSEIPAPNVSNRPPFGLPMPSRSTGTSVVLPGPLH